MHLAGRLVGRSCLVAALVFLALYLGATPPVADTMDTYHRVHYARMARPAEVWAEMADLRAVIRADQQTMARLQAEIEVQNRLIAEQEAWQAKEQ